MQQDAPEPCGGRCRRHYARRCCCCCLPQYCWFGRSAAASFRRSQHDRTRATLCHERYCRHRWLVSSPSRYSCKHRWGRQHRSCKEAASRSKLLSLVSHGFFSWAWRRRNPQPTRQCRWTREPPRACASIHHCRARYEATAFAAVTVIVVVAASSTTAQRRGHTVGRRLAR